MIVGSERRRGGFCYLYFGQRILYVGDLVYGTACIADISIIGELVSGTTVVLLYFL